MSIDKLKQAAILEIQKLEKKTRSLNKDIDKLKREKDNALADVEEANVRKASAILVSDSAYSKATEAKLEIKKLNTGINATKKEIDKLTKDAEKREIALTAEEEEIATIKANVLEKNKIAKEQVKDSADVRAALDRQAGMLTNMTFSKKQEEKKLDAIIKDAQKMKSEAEDNLKKAEQETKEAYELKIDSQIVLKECEDERQKYISLNKSIEIKDKEKSEAIIKAQGIIKNLQDRELKVKQDESLNLSTEKSLKEERNRVALKEAKVTKILDSLLSDKKLKDKLKELGLSK